MSKIKKVLINLIVVISFAIAVAIVLFCRANIDNISGKSAHREIGVDKYTVLFVTNGGSWEVGSPFESGSLQYTYGEYVDEPDEDDISHKGCHLEGWYTDRDFNHKWNFATDTVTQNMTLYANWERNIYNVEFREIFDSYNGEDIVLDSVQVPYGYTLILEGEASDANLTFKYTGPALDTPNFKNWISSTGSYTVTQDTVFFARYENENVYVLNVNYLYKNGAVASHNKITTLIEGGTYNIDTPTVRGYTPSTNNINGILNETTVLGFQADDETGNQDNIEVKKVDDSTYYVTYFIIYTPNATTYKVNHYLQKVDLSGYDLIEYNEYSQTIVNGSSKTVYVGDEINPIINSYTGFTYNNEISDQKGYAMPDGEAELNEYYNRNIYYIYSMNTGNTYFDPIPTVYQANITIPDSATKTGYIFNGWTWSYSIGGEAISPLSTMPARDIYITANWTASTTKFIISYYEENANNNGYVNIGNKEQSGNTGVNLSTLNLTNTIQNGFNALESENQFFNYNSTKTMEQNNDFDIVINGDGTTKINVYFSRNRYTITFNLNDRSDRTKAILEMNGVSYTTATTQYSFEAKYAQDISTMWPTATDFTQNPSSGSFYGWKRSNASTTYVSMRNDLTSDMLASTTNGSTSTYNASYTSSGNTTHLYYMVESFDQTSGTSTTRRKYQGVYYDSIPEYEQTVISTSTSFNAKELKNLTKAGSENTSSGNGNNRVYTFYFYYTRNQLNLTFWNVIEDETSLSTSLPYQTNLSTYATSVPANYPVETPGDGEWTFDNWYQDPDCTIPMDFNTQLLTNMIVYANWIPPKYNITFDVNEGDWNDTSSTYTLNTSTNKYEYSVDEATVLVPPMEPSRYGYTFEGWYYTAEINGEPRNIRYIFDESQKVYTDLNLTASWSNSLYVKYTVKYIKGIKDIDNNLITDISQYSIIESVLDDKVVNDILFDTTVTEQAANIIHSGEEIYYLADSQFKTLKLDAEDDDDNIIYFFYDASDEATYTVYYLRYNNKTYERSEEPDPTEYLAQPKTVTLTTAADGTIVSERAETIFGYTVRDNWYQELQLIANQNHNRMFFYYDNNSEYGDYVVNIYLMDNGTRQYGSTPDYSYELDDIVGTTIFASSYMGTDYIPASVWNTHSFDDKSSDFYIIVSDGEDVLTYLNIYLKIQDYVVTYQLDGGTWNDLSNVYTHEGTEYYESVVGGETCTEPEEPTKSGYNFIGWFDESNNEFDFTSPITSNTTLTAHWELRSDLSYIVKYLDQDTHASIATQKTSPDHTYGEVINAANEVIDISHYTYKSSNVASITLSGDVNSDVIELYYEANTYGYTIEYYYSGVKDDTLTQNLSGKYSQEINTYNTANLKYGYKYNGADNFPLTISDNVANNIIKIYFVIDETQTKPLTYTVEYYKDNVLVDSDETTITVQVLHDDTLTVDKSAINTTDKYFGYELDSVDPDPIPDTIATGSTIKVKYVKRTDLTGTINHYLTKADGTGAVLTDTTPLTGLTFDDYFVSADFKNTYAGYTYDYSDPEDFYAQNAVVNIYYKANTDTPYVVNHWGQKIGANASIHNEENYGLEYVESLYGESNTEVTPEVYSTSVFEAPPTQTVTIAPDGSTVVNYYYTRKSCELTLYKGLGIESVTGAGTYEAGTTATIDATVKEGYTWKNWTNCDCGGVDLCMCDPCDCEIISTDKLYSFDIYNSLIRTAEATPNTYTINYDGNGETGGSTTSSSHTYDEAKNLTPNGYEREYTITYNYNYEGSTNTTKTVAYGFNGWNDIQGGIGNAYDNEQSVINLVSTNNGSKTLYAQWTSSSNTNKPTRYGYLFAGWYEDENATGARLDSNGEYTPTADITLYAKWIIDGENTKTLTYTVEYYKDNVLADSDETSITVQVLEDDTLTVNKAAINTTNKYEGYVLDSVEPDPIPDTINTGSTIKVKYVKRTDLTGTINHYLTKSDGTNATLKESTPLSGLTFNDLLTGENYKKTYAGYTYYSSNPATINVAVAASSNVINLYYKANTNTQYVVNHWLQKLTGNSTMHDDTNYTLEDTETLTGESGTQVTPATIGYTGFTAPATETVTIAGDGSTIVDYYYTRNSYQVTLNKGNGISSVTGAGTYLYEAEVTIDAVVKAGYTWNNWTGDKESTTQTYTFTMPASSIENTANATIDTYTITYNLDGGTVSEDNPTSYNVETPTFNLHNPTKTGYTFIGWTGSNGDTPEIVVTIAKGSTGDKTYTANFSANTYTITYNGNEATEGSTASSSHTYDQAKNLTTNGYERKYTITYSYKYETPNTTKTVEYSFNSWNDVQGGTGNAYTDEQSVINLVSTNNGNKTLYAQWQSASDTNKPSRYGYLFEGWFETENTTGTRVDTNGEYTPTADITLYAKWVVNTELTKQLKYTVEYYKDGILADSDEYTKTVQVLEDEVLEVNKSVINTTNKYEGYVLDSVEPDPIPDTIATNSTIKVKYVKRTDLTGTINHYLTKADGTNATLKESTPLTGLTFNDLLTGENYKNTYAGYTYNSSNPATINVAVAASDNIINLYYRANNNTQYVVNHWLQKLDGDASIHDATNYSLEDTQNLTGETATEITPITNIYTGFTAPATQTVTIAGDGSTIVDYYYTRNSYQVTLNKGTGIESVTGDGTYLYGATVTIDATLKTGYSWNNWTGNEESTTRTYTFTMPANSINNTANATPNTYTITYNGNEATGGSTAASTHTYDQAKDLNANGYERKYTITYDYNYEGSTNTSNIVEYSFNGWNDVQGGTGNSFTDEQNVINLVTENNGNKNIYAQWQSASNTNKPTRYGYIFSGWYEDENTTGTRVDTDGEYTPTANITLYAKWTINTELTKQLKYTVEYYKDDLFVESDEFTKTVQVLEDEVLEVNKSAINTTNKYVGYVLDKTEPTPIPDTTANNSTIKIFYKKGTFNYRVEYYYDGTIDNTKTEYKQDTYQKLIETYTPKSITGYALNNVINLPLTITENEATNVIKVNYVRADFMYTVKYYFDEVIRDSLTESFAALYNDSITSYIDKVEEGYKLDRVETIPFVVTEINDNNIINVYYKTDPDQTKVLKYTVEYYKDNVKANSEEFTKTVQVLQPNLINLDKTRINITDKYDGYYYNRIELIEPDSSGVIGGDPSNNSSTDLDSLPDLVVDKATIKVYYTIRNDLKYTVQYIDKDINEEIKTKKEVNNQIYNTTINSNSEKIDIDGYNFDSYSANSITIQTNESLNNIKIFYTKRNDLEYRVNYLEKDSDDDDSNNNVIHTQKVQDHMIFKSVITSSNEVIDIDGYNFDSVSKANITIGTNATENVISIYYTKKTDLKYTVNYLEKDSDDDDSNNKVLATQKVQGGVTFETIITSANEVIAIAGYNYKNANVDSISVKTNEALNVITLYYTPRNDLKYKVNYLLKDSDDDDSNNTVLSPSKTVTNQTYLKEINPADEQRFVTGYKVVNYSSNPLIIGLGENVLTIYYTKDESQTDTIDYTIQYYKDGVMVPTDTENHSSTIYVLDKITFSPNVNKYEGYNYDSVNTIIPEYVSNNDVIKVYYVSRTDLSYKVNYLEKNTSAVLQSAKQYDNQRFGSTISSANKVVSI